MSFSTKINSTKINRLQAFVLGLALLNISPALAQKSPAKVKTNKTKAKTIAATSGTAGKTETLAVVPAPSIPQPTSPLASAPQKIVAATAGASTALSPAEESAGWLTDLGAAQAQAKATNRPVLVVFSGSDWCKPCIMYEQEVFSKPEFTAFAKDKLVLAHFDFPRQKRNQPTAAQLKLNEAAAAQLNREGDFPLAVIVAPDGKVLAKTGYIAGGPTAFEAYLKKVIPSL